MASVSGKRFASRWLQHGHIRDIYFGPYLDLTRPAALDRRGNVSGRRFNDLARRGPPVNTKNAFEVLAGAISWGFKSLRSVLQSFGRTTGVCAEDR
jgi:hypothetical protein